MQLSTFRYRFPFTEPFKTGTNSYSEREGVIFILEVNGMRAFGEAAPLPGFSTESLEEVLEDLEKNWDSISDFFQQETDSPGLNEHTMDKAVSPALGFALDTLRYDFHAKKERRPLRNVLFKDPLDSIPVNAALGLESPGSLLDRAGGFWDRGFRTFKLKVGRDFERELEAIEQIRSAFPDSGIRIDANQSWEPDEAETNLGRLAHLDLEYCEEPLHNPDADTLSRLQEAVSVPLALDESLHRPEGCERLIRGKAGKVVIIKPMVFGSFKKIFETYRLAVTHDYMPVFTTSMESGIGRMMTANFASGLGSNQFAHGLATGSLLKMDVWHDRAYINSGHFFLPDGHGLGQERRPEVHDLRLEPIVF